MIQGTIEKVSIITLIISIITFVFYLFRIPPAPYIQREVMNIAFLSAASGVASIVALFFIENKKRALIQYHKDILGNRQFLVERKKTTLETSIGYHVYINDVYEGVVAYDKAFVVKSYSGVHQVRIKSRTGVSNVLHLDIRENEIKKVMVAFNPHKDINDADFDAETHECYYLSMENL